MKASLPFIHSTGEVDCLVESGEQHGQKGVANGEVDAVVAEDHLTETTNSTQKQVILGMNFQKLNETLIRF